MIYAAQFGDLAPCEEDVRHLFSSPEEDSNGFWWLNLDRPAEEDVRTVCEAFGIHPLTIEDIITQETREKVELFPTYYFASIHSFSQAGEVNNIKYTPFNMYIVVFRHGTISFSFRSNDHASHVQSRMTKAEGEMPLSSDWICYAMMWVSYCGLATFCFLV